MYQCVVYFVRKNAYHPLMFPQNEEKYSFDEKNPFVQGGDETDVASVGYR